MTPEQRAVVITDPTAVTPDVVASTWAAFTPDHLARGPAVHRTERDLAYGPLARQRMDLHVPLDARAGERRPVVVFVPGGGFVGGSRQTEGTPFYDHVGRWATERGALAATVDYRLAPAATWPAGARDVAGAIELVRAIAPDHGGDPDQVVLVGHSAGAAHVAGYVAGHGGPVSGGVAGAALLSGLFDLHEATDDPLLPLYFGTDAASHPDREAVGGLVVSDVPLLLGYAELDPPLFHGQLARLLHAHWSAHGSLPPVVCALGHSHISEIVSLGLRDDPLGEALARFLDDLPAVFAGAKAPEGSVA